MKTFETEKHNIPEGATHYQDEESGVKVFAFFKNSDGFSYYFAPGYENKWMKLDDHSEMLRDCVKPIPQTKEVEWENGQYCMYMDSGEVHKFIGLDPARDDFCYIKADCSAVNWVEVAKLSKPESPEAKKEREDRERGIYELSMGIAENVKVIDGSVSDYRHDIAVYLYDAGYRVEK